MKTEINHMIVDTNEIKKKPNKPNQTCFSLEHKQKNKQHLTKINSTYPTKINKNLTKLV